MAPLAAIAVAFFKEEELYIDGNVGVVEEVVVVDDEEEFDNKDD